MKSISIVFSRSSSAFAPFSWLIMKSENTDYSHVAFKIVDEDTGITMYYQASHTMVNTMSEAIFLAQEKVISSFDFQIDDALIVNGKRFAQERLGLPYGVTSSFGLAYVQIAKWLNIKATNPFKEVGAQYVCSQFVAAFLEEVDGLSISMDLNDVTPRDLFPIVESLPKVWIKTSHPG